MRGLMWCTAVLLGAGLLGLGCGPKQEAPHDDVGEHATPVDGAPSEAADSMSTSLGVPPDDF